MSDKPQVPSHYGSMMSNYRRCFQDRYGEAFIGADYDILALCDVYVGLEGGAEAEEAAVLDDMHELQDKLKGNA